MITPELRKPIEPSSNYHPDVNLVPLSRARFPEGTLGHTVFPELLEGRLRPEDALDIPLRCSAPNTRRQLGQAGILTHADLLGVEMEQLAELGPSSKSYLDAKLPDMMEPLASKLCQTPHGRLLGAVTRLKGQGPVDTEDEPKLFDAVERWLDELGDSSQRGEQAAHLLRSRFGINNWKSKSLEQLGAEYGVSKAHMGTRLSKALSLARFSGTEFDIVKRYAALPLGSLGRALGYSYYTDAEEEVRVLDKIGLSEEALEAIRVPGTDRLPHQTRDWDSFWQKASFTGSVLDAAIYDEISAKYRRSKRAKQFEHDADGLYLSLYRFHSGAQAAGAVSLEELGFSSRAIDELHAFRLSDLPSKDFDHLSSAVRSETHYLATVFGFYLETIVDAAETV